MNKILFPNIRTIDPFSKMDKYSDVLIKDNLIIAIEEPNTIQISNIVKIEHSKKLVLIPGLIDIRVTSKDPGLAHAENLESLLKSSAKSGITTLVCLPNTLPILDDAAIVNSLKHRSESFGLSRLLMYGAASKGLSGEKLAELGLLSEAGVVGFSNGNTSIYNAMLMQRVLSYSSILSLPVIQHADIPELSFETDATAGEISTRLGLQGSPSITESMLIERDVQLLKMTGGQYHVSHISTKQGIQSVIKAKEEGLRISCDTSPPYMLLNDFSLMNYDTRFKLIPPLRQEEDRLAVIEGLKNGSIDAISSDHLAQDRDSKLLPFTLAKAGSLGIETLLAATLSLVHSEEISLMKAIELLTSGPASILNLNSGRLKVGNPADLTIIDPNISWIVKGEKMLSLSSNSCFEGLPFQGKVFSCWKDGKKIF